MKVIRIYSIFIVFLQCFSTTVFVFDNCLTTYQAILIHGNHVIVGLGHTLNKYRMEFVSVSSIEHYSIPISASKSNPVRKT